MALSGYGPVQRKRFRFRARTRHHWFEGYLSMLSPRLVDALNGDDTREIILEEALVTRDGAPSEQLEFASINGSAVLFAIPLAEPERVREPFLWVKKRPEPSRIGIAEWEIRGDVYLIEEMRLRAYLTSTRARFFAVANATIWRVDSPDTGSHYDVVFVNRERLDFLLPAGAK